MQQAGPFWHYLLVPVTGISVPSLPSLANASHEEDLTTALLPGQAALHSTKPWPFCVRCNDCAALLARDSSGVWLRTPQGSGAQ